MRQPLNKFNKKRLQRWLSLFFLALLIPTVLLVQQSYSRLKWETFHQHQLMAAELSERIDQRLLQLINTENQRAFGDFTFVNTITTKDITPQRSPLAVFPVNTQPPGLLGYFQVDAAGRLLTPIVPTNNSIPFGIPADELQQRVALQNQIQDILAANQLVRKPYPLNNAEVITALEEAEYVLGRGDTNNRLDSTQNEQVTGKLTTQQDMAPAASVMPENIVLGQAADNAMADIAPTIQQQAPIAFKELKELSKQSAQKNDYGRVEDLQLKRNYQQKETERKRLASAERQLQKKSNASKKEKIANPKAGRATNTKMPRPRIHTFASEIDRFEFSQLDNQHFVLFRQVWRDGQRYTQGLLIEQSTFLDEVINDAFTQTTLSTMSDLLVAYQGNILRAFSGNPGNSRYNNQTLTKQQITQQPLGEQLYQVRLSDPLSDLQLIYSITQLPIGPGGQLILWLALILGTVLLGGFYLMYRLGLSQIELANQQQDFVSAVSHELKTPLTSIRMYGEMLLQDWAPPERKNTYYQFIFDESERLSRLINNVLQLARMTRNEQKAELATHNVPDLVRDIKAKITSQVEAAEFVLTVDMDDKLASKQIMIDADWLTQIMINLVDNAIKFSATAEVKHIILNVESTAKQQVSFTISDHGPGIDKQQMKQIFQLFYRSENELTRDTVGTGIGLSLVHQMTTAMGGKVSVENRGLEGEFSGAAFRVVFPILDTR